MNTRKMTHEAQTISSTALQPIHMEDEQVAHLAGVFDAVGSLSAQISKTEDTRIGFRFHPIVRINRPAEEEALMGKLAAYCDDRGVNHGIAKRSDSGSFVFEVKNPEGIRNFLLPMMDYLVVNYEPSLLMLEEIIPRVEDEMHLTEDGLIEIMGFVDTLRESARYGPDAKYTQKFFRDLWDR